MDKELKPCPFCGSTAELKKVYKYDGYQGESPDYIAHCTCCGASISSLREELTVRLWNAISIKRYTK